VADIAGALLARRIAVRLTSALRRFEIDGAILATVGGLGMKLGSQA
jgi:hypothetical protein